MGERSEEGLTVEPISLRRRDGSAGAAVAHVRLVPRTRRWMLGGGAIGFGLLLALVFLPVPGLHFFSTWLFPLIGLVIGTYLWRKRGDIDRVEGDCPACTQRVTLPGGPIEEAMWRRCPSCGDPVELVLADRPDGRAHGEAAAPAAATSNGVVGQQH